MIRYQVRSKDLIDLVNEIKSNRLISSPYFQRNLVWRQTHKVEFIETILLGYPFPQIFIAKGDLDIPNMQTTSCLVDGQQRMNAIVEFINNVFPVGNRYYSQLSPIEKTEFLKYQIPIIDLDISNLDPRLKEIFNRLNRTFYSLSAIEKLATEYAASEFMLVAILLTSKTGDENDYDNEDNINPFKYDPGIPKSFIDWAGTKKIKYFNKVILESDIFTSYEISRKVHLMFTLNVMATIEVGYYNRNEFAFKYLDDFSNELPDKDDLIAVLENAAHKYSKMKFGKKSYWLNKANAFSLITLFATHQQEINELEDKEIKHKLEQFEHQLPAEYIISAKEAVNNKRERLIRYNSLKDLLFN